MRLPTTGLPRVLPPHRVPRWSASPVSTTSPVVLDLGHKPGPLSDGRCRWTTRLCGRTSGRLARTTGRHRQPPPYQRHPDRQGDIIGLTCRVGRAVIGTVDIIRDVIESGRSILLLGRPGVGKTTLLREAARVLADEFRKRVVVVDTSNEIAGDGDIPHPGIGAARRMQVPILRCSTPSCQAVENHARGGRDRRDRHRAERWPRGPSPSRRQLIATAHGNTLDNLLQGPRSRSGQRYHAVTLSDEKPGAAVRRLERERRPFDVVVEIRKDRLAVPRRRRRRGPLPAWRARGPSRTRRSGEIQSSPGWTPVGCPRAGARRSRNPDATGRRVLRVYPYAVSRNRLVGHPRYACPGPHRRHVFGRRPGRPSSRSGASRS
jgi:energy-coupling factor transporter ATP-binding protein EcfA2